VVTATNLVFCYGPYISSSRTTGKRHKQTSGRSAGDARTSRTMGQGVAELYDVTRPVRNVGTCHGTARDTRYARRVAFLSLFDIARQMVYPPRLPLYRFSLSRIPVKLSSNPLKSSTTAVRSYQFYESDAYLSSVRI
jgi:hypothetical protein